MLIIGAGFGGLAAVRALRHAPVEVVLLDRRNFHLFQPLLYQVATGGLSPGEIAYPIRSVLRRQKNAQVLLAEASRIDLERQEVHLTQVPGEAAASALTYDFLILAPGATHSYFGHPQWAQLAPGLKDLEDALEIRSRILLAFEHAERETNLEKRSALLTFAIVGAGPTGVELAGAIADIARRVLREDFRSIDPRETVIVLLEGGDRVLPAFPPRLSAKAAAALAGMGVDVRTGARVTNITPEGVEVGGTFIAARTALWAAGVAASPLAQTLGVPLDATGRVPVKTDLSLAQHTNVFIIGDLARLDQLPGLAPVALQQGRAAAANIVRTLAGKPRRSFHYLDKGNLATIGRASAVADIRGLQLSGLLAWLVWIFVHILYLIGFRNRLLVSMEWAWDYLSPQQAARLITGRPRL
ncbi:MAG TPA: NAD(P)/FAD-dependent oxidoreductase [Terriglobales bacterium]